MFLFDRPLPFPKTHPTPYLPLSKEPVFEAGKHLALEMPSQSLSLADLGYAPEEIKRCASSFAYSNAFRILSSEGVAAMEAVCQDIYGNRNESTGTGANRLGSYARGAGYRSRFIRDFCDSPDIAEHLSKIAGVTLGRHSVPAVACGINYAPEDISRAVDTWHVDSVNFDVVMMVTDPSALKGGEFQIFKGTRQEGQELLGIAGEEGGDAALPEARISSIPFPGAGYGFLQQGTHIFHRACRLLEKANRITLIPSFEVLPAHDPDSTNAVNMADWADPGISAELARHEVWRASARLEQLLSDISLTDEPRALGSSIREAVSQLNQFADKLESRSQ
jgi:hypothetical protein